MNAPLGKAWICSLCAQGFTRRTSARRHNERLHNSQATIIRPIEYLVGRLKGQFESPQDPLEYRRPGPYRLGSEPPMIAHNNPEKPTHTIPPSNDNLSRPLNPNNFTPAVSPEFHIPKSSNPTSMEQFSIGLKLQELAVLLHKHCSPDSARLYLMWTKLNLNSGNVDILETNLNLFRSLDNIRLK